MRVLLVDDDCVTGETLALQLRGRGHDVDWAANGEAALTRLRVHAADALVVDQYMPGIDGMELLRRLRTHAGTANLPVVLITAAAAGPVEEMRRELPGLAPAALVRKPFEVGQVVAALDSLCQRPA